MRQRKGIIRDEAGYHRYQEGFLPCEGEERGCVELPKEDETPGMCGILKKSMCGARAAAQNWEQCYRDAHLEWDSYRERHRRVCSPPTMECEGSDAWGRLYGVEIQ